VISLISNQCKHLKIRTDLCFGRKLVVAQTLRYVIDFQPEVVAETVNCCFHFRDIAMDRNERLEMQMEEKQNSVVMKVIF